MTILSRLTRTQRIVLFLFLALLMNSLVRAATGYFLGWIGTAVLVVAFLVLLPFAVLPPIVRRVTWRVRNRLFLTYFLVGVLPIILIFLFAQLALDLVLSQTTNFLLHEQIDQRIDGVYAQAERRAQAASAKREAVPVNSGETVVLRGGGRSSTSPDTG